MTKLCNLSLPVAEGWDRVGFRERLRYSCKLDCEIDNSCVAIQLPWHLVIRPCDSHISPCLFHPPPHPHRHRFHYNKAWNIRKQYWECRLVTARLSSVAMTWNQCAAQAINRDPSTKPPNHQRQRDTWWHTMCCFTSYWQSWRKKW